MQLFYVQILIYVRKGYWNTVIRTRESNALWWHELKYYQYRTGTVPYRTYRS